MTDYKRNLFYKKLFFYITLTLCLCSFIVKAQDGMVKMTWDYSKKKRFEIPNHDSINILIYQDSILIETLNFKPGLEYLASPNHHYQIKAIKKGYYSYNYFLDANNIPSSKPVKFHHYLLLRPLNSVLPEDKYAQTAIESYIYNSKAKKFILDLDYGVKKLKDFIKFHRLNNLINQNPLLKAEFDEYTKQIKDNETKIQEEKYKNALKEQDLIARTNELEQSKLINAKKEADLKLIEKEKQLQGLKLVEQQNKFVLEQNKLIKKEIEASRKSKIIDSLHKIQLQKELSIINNELDLKKSQVEINKKEKELLSSREEQNRKNEEIKRQKTIGYIFSIGLLLLIVFTVFILRSLNLNKKKNKIISTQKHIVEEKQREIIESITYAKRLQEAILPPIELLNNNLRDNFILYKPKDIVAGDFYWAEKINDLFFIAAADSTGHGVPGCMVSVVCSNALNRAINEFNIRETGKILDKTKELVVETFQKSSSDVQDGMDISLMCINYKTRKVQWSGANNSLWIIDNGVFREIKGDKQAIGKTHDVKPFTTHEIDYHESMLFYIFTDGYADQFGGPKGKKFKYKQFEEFLVSISDKKMDEQKTLILNKFNSWKGNLEQIDDVCIIGFRV